MKVISNKKQNNKVIVLFDNDNVISLFEDIFLEYRLFPNSEISEDVYSKIFEQNEERIAINFAKKILSIRMYSIKSIKTKLLRKISNENIVNRVINLLLEYKYLDDFEFAKLFIKDRLNNKKKGSVKIKFDLLKEGIEPEIIDELLSDIDIDTEITLAVKLAEAKIRTIKNSDEIKTKSKVYRFLQSRGFNSNICNSVLKQLFKNNYEVIYE
ncbi:MAG TPA: regulatory protein RecX [Melioribacteraceae bacterium]|nr:regulatory protein RecX [Melioribacteraceae bacterium]